jgi:hypothetical protein
MNNLFRATPRLLHTTKKYYSTLLRMEVTDGGPLVTGGATNFTLPDLSSVTVNVEEHASAPPQKGRWTIAFYWLQQVRCDPLLDHRKTDDSPRDADTVIVGSGISGALITQHHLEIWPLKSVVVLEAHESCSGASGRNAGHCKPDQWRHYERFEKAYGREQALKIINNESETWRALVAYVKENNVDCDLWIGDTLDKEVAKATKEIFEGYRDAGGKIDHIKITHDQEEAAKDLETHECESMLCVEGIYTPALGDHFPYHMRQP